MPTCEIQIPRPTVPDANEGFQMVLAIWEGTPSLAESISLRRGEAWECSMEGKNALILSGVEKVEKRRRSAKA